MTNQVDSIAEIEKSDSRGELLRWTREIENASNLEEKWKKEAATNFKIYKDQAEGSQYSKNRYNVFWSNTQTLRPLVFSKLPNSNITRRYLDNDRNSRLVSEMMERAVTYCLDTTKSESVFNAIRDDFLIGGRGVARVSLDPAEIITITQENENGEIEEFEDIDSDTKRVRISYVNWEDFLIAPSRRWEDVRWIAFRHKMNREQLVEQFGKKGNDVLLDSTVLTTLSNDSKDIEDCDILKVTDVWEIWNKDKKEVIFYSPGYDKGLLSKEEDPYNLKDFFPTTAPLGSQSSPDSLMPIPLYRMYKSQAEELNSIDSRIKSLVQQVKFTGVYSSTGDDSDISALMNNEDGMFSPQSFIAGSDNIANNIFIKPIVDIVNVIAQLNDQKARVLQNIRDITGLSDIVRGTTLASETATAQRLKGNFAISRIQPLQKEMESYVRNIIRLQAELIVENYTADELAVITNLKVIDVVEIEQQAMARAEALIQEGTKLINPNDPEAQEKQQQLLEQAQEGVRATLKEPTEELKGYAVTPEELQQLNVLLKNDLLREYSIDVETDSTVRLDQEQEKQDRVEYINAIANFSSTMFPLVQAEIINKDAFNAILSFASKPFKVGRNLEEYLTSGNQDEEEKGPSIEEQQFVAENNRRDLELQLKAKEVEIKQQEVDIKKAQVLQNNVQFQDKLEFEDANKEADRRAKTTDDLVQDRTKVVTDLIRNSNVIERGAA